MCRVSPEGRVLHPLRPPRETVDSVLAEVSPSCGRLCAPMGRPSVAPERLLRGVLLKVLCRVLRERRLVEQHDYNLLCGLDTDTSTEQCPEVNAGERGRRRGLLWPQGGAAIRAWGVLPVIPCFHERPALTRCRPV
jgi:hypothetical protein